MFKHRASLRLLLAIGSFHALPAAAAVDVVCDKSFTVSRGNETLIHTYCGNLDLDLGDDPFAERAIIVIHGSSRNADDYFRYVQGDGDVVPADLLETTAIIAPQFLTDRDVAAHELPANRLYWSSGGWKKGNTSNSKPYFRPFNVSSFEVVDLLIERLSDEQAFPNIAEIIIAGHSAGGQFVHRYAAGGHAQDGVSSIRPDLSFRYIVANPSSYLYFSPERAAAGTKDVFSRPNSRSCSWYNDYKYGLADKNSYMAGVGDQTLVQRYASRRVIIMLGADDNDANDRSMARGCAAMLQGAHRLERGEIFFNHAVAYFGRQILDHQSVEIIPGVGHSARRMFQSDCGLALLYDHALGECGPPGSAFESKFDN